MQIRKIITNAHQTPRNILMGLCLTLGSLLPIPAVAAAPDRSLCITQSPTPKLTPDDRGIVKFQPGYYLHVGQRRRVDYLKPVIEEISGTQFKGVVKRYTWSDLETSEGVYNFSQIIEDINYVRSAGKKLMVFIQIKYNSMSGGNVVPSYLSSNPENFYRLTDARDTLARFSRPIVVNRFSIFLKKLAETFDNTPEVAAIMFNETAMGVPESVLNTYPDGETERHIMGLLQVDKTAACLFRKTPVFQITNFPPSLLGTMSATYKEHGIGMMTADVLTKDASLLNFSYKYLPQVAPFAPIGALVAYNNYLHSSFNDYQSAPDKVTNGLSVVESINSLTTFAANTLKPNYVIWTRVDPDNSYYVEILDRARHWKFPALSKTCPSMYRCN